MSYYYEKEPDVESGAQTPSLRVRLPRPLLEQIDALTRQPGQPFLDRNECIRSLIVDGFRHREVRDA
jgi:hypothetical protein